MYFSHFWKVQGNVKFTEHEGFHMFHVTRGTVSSSVLTWVKPAHGSSRSHDVGSTSDKVAPISDNDAVLGHQLVHTVQNLQRVQVVFRLLISFSPGIRQQHS